VRGERLGTEPPCAETPCAEPVSRDTGAQPISRQMGSRAPAARHADRPLLEVSDLRVSFATAGGPVRAVDGVSFSLGRGEALALVGESGSGKSVCARSLIGLAGSSNAAVAGSALLEGRQLIGMPGAQLRRVRGAEIAIVFQDPMSSLNPTMRVGEQIAEQIRSHEPAVSRAAALERAGKLMERMRIPAARERLRSHPHELSGGMRQRAMLAMALSLSPKVLLADEPTTALDVTVQAQILDQLKELREGGEMGIVLITHDFAVVADVADRIAVMRAGQIVEQGAAGEILGAPRHPYTRELLRALEPPAVRRAPPAVGSPLVEVEDLRVSFRQGGRTKRMLLTQSRLVSFRRQAARLEALRGVSLSVRQGETLAVVGESGSGKTTLIRSIARLIDAQGGRIRFDGRDVARARGRGLAPLRSSVGMVFQDPQASLNPRRRIGGMLERALRAHGVSVARARDPRARDQVDGLLERVGLTAAHADRFPHELSGGERQRVGIARALAGTPRLVLLDEPVSSLDASIRRGVIELLAELQRQIGCSYVLVSHDLMLVAGVADRIAVMRGGEIVELGDAGELLQRPRHPYTQELLAACPVPPGGPSRWNPISPGGLPSSGPSPPGGVRSGGWAQRQT
jgi:peptide/nickel transport system ATP-binding protein